VKLPIDEDGETTNIDFQISLPAFLETLQIFGAADAAARQSRADADSYRSNLRNYRPDAFSHQTLGMPGTCSLVYSEAGEPFRIVMEEAGVNTTCKLTTYLPEFLEDIPFDLENVSFKVIMLSRWLLDSLGEMAPTSPDRVTIKVSRRAPYLHFSSHGPLGSSSVDFTNGKELLETLQVHGDWRQTFKFDLLKSASEAMRIAKKVSMRGDPQGVLSLQLMVEVDGGGHNFLDFRFVPYAMPDDEENGPGNEADE
jgi:cell cycle checkpoint protein